MHIPITHTPTYHTLTNCSFMLTTPFKFISFLSLKHPTHSTNLYHITCTMHGCPKLLQSIHPRIRGPCKPFHHHIHLHSSSLQTFTYPSLPFSLYTTFFMPTSYPHAWSHAWNHACHHPSMPTLPIISYHLSLSTPPHFLILYPRGKGLVSLLILISTVDIFFLCLWVLHIGFEPLGLGAIGYGLSWLF